MQPRERASKRRSNGAWALFVIAILGAAAGYGGLDLFTRPRPTSASGSPGSSPGAPTDGATPDGMTPPAAHRPGDRIVLSGRPTPLEQEALDGLKALKEAEESYRLAHDRYTPSVRGLAPELAPCPDGSQSAVPDLRAPSQRVGCHFVYSAQLKGEPPDDQVLVLTALGASRGAEGLVFEVASEGADRWIPFRVLGEEGPPPTPSAPMPLESLQAEARAGLQRLFTAERSYLAERDRYTTTLIEAGFAPESWCPDGARRLGQRASAPNQARGCHFLYEVQGDERHFRAFARGAVEEARSLGYRIDSDGPTPGVPVQEKGH